MDADSNSKQTTDNIQLKTENRQLTTDHVQLKTDDGQLATGHPRSRLSGFQLSVSNLKLSPLRGGTGCRLSV